MEPSRRNNLSAATAAVILLLLFIMAAEMAPPVGASRPPCSHLSGDYIGECMPFGDVDCADTCNDESPDNIGGGCGDDSRCYCATRCPP
ncbi:unnamed protein product [Urochloa decumbens]|uniref:Uncharacterized protein n=1 Tax=Urochloa decumbens TaxID=240449 RepID=A0ABC9BPU6_9POAL